MGAVGFHFEPLAAHVLSRVRDGQRIFADETTLPTLNPGAGKVKTAWLWAYARDDRPFAGAGPPMVAYRYEDSRSGDCVARHLGDYRGILQCDGYAGYAKIARAPHSNGLRLAGCWAHLRRKFYDLHVNGESIVATATVEQLTQLWSIEDQVRGQPPQARLEARRAASADVVRTLYDLWAGELPRVSGKSKLADAIRYAQSRRPALEVFLADGRAELDSNIVERAIRPQAITRKNALFAGSATGGRTWAAIATMLQTCRMNEVDPSAWASQTLERIANRWPNSNIDALMPWNFKPVE